MRIKHYRHAALLSIAVSNLSNLCLADPINPLQFVDISEYSAVQRRALDCPADYFSCEDQGAAFANTCCENGQLCSLDAQQQPACCPTTATCTGVAPTTTTAAPSFVSNSYFSFPYIATSFPNTVACSSALSQCSRNYLACVTGLAGNGGGYGVTIVVPGGGGTTVAPTRATVPSATATSVCSSLSSEACYNIQTGVCAQAGTTAGFTIGGANGAPRPTAACMAGVVAGVGMGLMGAQF
ncbi:hypothetical protein F4809DRAFT_272401 [Biscogniauxia mediterranea]|nr:hypothetical protein F4809DRAFT_272401 [Biscogniauxia mediterranea]